MKLIISTTKKVNSR